MVGRDDFGQCWLEDWIFRCIFGHVGAKMVDKKGKLTTERRKMGAGRRKLDSRSTQVISIAASDGGLGL